MLVNNQWDLSQSWGQEMKEYDFHVKMQNFKLTENTLPGEKIAKLNNYSAVFLLAPF